jgi:predicted nucleotide-binding protein (sugar kinase/HSP70/actin superfamily)
VTAAAPTPGPQYLAADRGRRTIFIPVLSPEFSQVMRVAIEAEGHKVLVADGAEERAIELGKRHVHNDICFPAQLNVGELLVALERGRVARDEVAVGLSKNCLACRALQYSALARKALDEAGYADVPIITSGDDPLGRHPGLHLGWRFKRTTMLGLAYADCLGEMRQRTLPYERQAGATARVHDEAMAEGLTALAQGRAPLVRALERAVEAFNAIPADRSAPKPVVGVVGEILINYHPAGNMGIGAWLLRHGMEPRFPPVLNFFRQDVVNADVSAARGFSRWPVLDRLLAGVTEAVYEAHTSALAKRMRRFRWYEPHPGIRELATYAHGLMDLAFSSGEGWLMPAEIAHLAERGVKAFVIVQPFGCLPNHVSGRGTIKAIKERYPQVQLVAVDYDPDVSVANIENRLQLLLMGALASARAGGARGGPSAGR